MPQNFGRWTINYVIRPPLMVLKFILTPLDRILFGFLDKLIARRNEDRLRQDIRTAAAFLFEKYHGLVVPNEGVPFPPGFDYAFVTVAVNNILIRFCRGRGELDVRLASKNSACDWHDLALLVNLIDPKVDRQRTYFSDLREVSSLLQPNIDRLRQTLGENQDQEFTQQLKVARLTDQAAAREAEWEINKRGTRDR
jgi:hypothetical protein